jgi:hypothetical protein
MKKIITFIFIITLVSCEKNNQIIEDPNNLLIGNWTDVSYEDGKRTFSRSNNLPENKYGISFKINGDYKENSSGWCGTPPLSYFIIDGDYQMEDNLISISKGNVSQEWRIMSLSDTSLVLKKELTAQEIAHQELMKLFNEIENIAYDKTCKNSSDWRFVGYGAKACGGFKGYITYSKNIDTILFLKKYLLIQKQKMSLTKNLVLFQIVVLLKNQFQ